jgi:hypothetical protein
MLLAEEREMFKQDWRTMKEMAADTDTASLGMSVVDLGVLLQTRYENSSSAAAGFAPRQCPVQLDLLPLRPCSHAASCTPAPSSTNDTFSWQPLRNRCTTNSGGSDGYDDDGEVEIYSSGGGGGGGHGGASSSPRGGIIIDMNQLPSTTECDEAVLSSSPSSTGVKLPEGSKKFYEFDLEERERVCDLSSRGGGGSDDEDGGGTNATRKKLRLSKEQSALLEESFKDRSTLNPKQKNALAKQLNLRPRQVEVWFQNRRARYTHAFSLCNLQTEVNCESQTVLGFWALCLYLSVCRTS